MKGLELWLPWTSSRVVGFRLWCGGAALATPAATLSGSKPKDPGFATGCLGPVNQSHVNSAPVENATPGQADAFQERPASHAALRII